MDTCKTTLSTANALNEQIARQVFEALPERGPVLVIMDREGNCWPSNSEEFGKLGLDETLLADLRAKVDDGAEPVITQVGETSLAVAQLATDRTKCGYLLVALARYSCESTLTNIDLVEALLNQIALIARLIEKSNTLTHAHIRHYGLTDTLTN